MAPTPPATRRELRSVGLCVVAALIAFQAFQVAIARADNGDPTVRACADNKTGVLRLPTTEQPECDAASETSVAWNQSEQSVRWYRDADSDGYGDWYASLDSPAQPAGYVANRLDCNDNAAVSSPDVESDPGPGDRDCDGLAAEDRLVPVYLDQDRDGYGSKRAGSEPFNEVPAGLSTTWGDCNDRNAAVDAYVCRNHGDKDGDGHWAYQRNGDDCADGDPLSYPGRPEVADALGHDEDCDPVTGFVLGFDRLAHDPRPHVVPFRRQLARDSRGRLSGGGWSRTLWTPGLSGNRNGAIEALATPPGCEVDGCATP